MKNVILYILGFPGSGKYTIAREICGADDAFRLVDNHLINNPVFSLIPLDGHSPIPERAWHNVEQIWQVVKDTLINISPEEDSFVLTNALFESQSGDRERYEDVAEMAKARGAALVPVRLFCGLEEMARRIVSEDRALRYKETNEAAPKRFFETDEVLRIEHENLLNLDVTDLPAERAAAQILAHARNVAGEEE